MFLLCGAARLARFNITKNPIPKNPGRPDRKYFVGLPIPAGAATVAAVVYACNSEPLRWWVFSAAWLALLALLAFLMVSTWRYPSFKDINLLRPRSFLVVIALGGAIYLILFFSQPTLLATDYGVSVERHRDPDRRHLRRRMRGRSHAATGAATWLRRWNVRWWEW